MFERNECSDNTEPAFFGGSNIEIRGHSNVVRDHVIATSAGYHVKIQSDAPTYDNGGNVVAGNTLSGAAGPAFEIKSTGQQGPICGNVLAAAVRPDPGAPDPAAACP